MNWCCWHFPWSFTAAVSIPNSGWLGYLQDWISYPAKLRWRPDPRKTENSSRLSSRTTPSKLSSWIYSAQSYPCLSWDMSAFWTEETNKQWRGHIKQLESLQPSVLFDGLLGAVQREIPAAWKFQMEGNDHGQLMPSPGWWQWCFCQSSTNGMLALCFWLLQSLPGFMGLKRSCGVSNIV